MAPPVGSSLCTSPASSTSSSLAAGTDWHRIAIYFICLFAGTVLVILLIFCLPKDILTQPSLLSRWRAARQAKRQQQQQQGQRQRPTISIPLQNTAPSSSSSSFSSSQAYNNSPNKSRVPNPHPFGSASWRDHEARGATPAETAALKIESLQNQLEMLNEALDHERAALEFVERRNRELSFRLKMQMQKKSEGGGGKEVEDGYDEDDFNAVDPEVLKRVYEKIHQPLDKPKPKTASSSSTHPSHPPTYPEAQQQQQQGRSQTSPTRALSPLMRHPPPFSFYSPDDDPMQQPSSSTPPPPTTTTPPPPPPTFPRRLTPKQNLPSSKIHAYAQRHLHNGLAVRRSVGLEVIDGGPPRGGVRAQCAVVCNNNTVGEEGEGQREGADCDVHERAVRTGLNPFADPAGGGF